MLDLNPGTLLWIEGIPKRSVQMEGEYNVREILDALERGAEGLYFVAMCIRKEREHQSRGTFTMNTD